MKPLKLLFSHKLFFFPITLGKLYFILFFFIFLVVQRRWKLMTFDMRLWFRTCPVPFLHLASRPFCHFKRSFGVEWSWAPACWLHILCILWTGANQRVICGMGIGDEKKTVDFENEIFKCINNFSQKNLAAYLWIMCNRLLINITWLHVVYVDDGSKMNFNIWVSFASLTEVCFN